MSEPLESLGAGAMMRVYDGAQVDEYVDHLLARIRSLEAQVAGRSDGRLMTAGDDIEGAERALGRALLQAQQLADEAAVEARAERDRILEQARREREQILADHSQERAAILAAAHKEADDVRAQALHERAQLLAGARREADATFNRALEQTQTIAEQARQNLARVTREWDGYLSQRTMSRLEQPEPPPEPAPRPAEQAAPWPPPERPTAMARSAHLIAPAAVPSSMVDHPDLTIDVRSPPVGAPDGATPAVSEKASLGEARQQADELRAWLDSDTNAFFSSLGAALEDTAPPVSAVLSHLPPPTGAPVIGLDDLRTPPPGLATPSIPAPGTESAPSAPPEVPDEWAPPTPESSPG